MPGRWTRWIVALAVVTVVLAWYVTSSAAVRTKIAWLASQPGVRTAFQAEGGSSDALIVLITFAVGTPMLAGVALVLVSFASHLTAAALYQVRLPERLAVPVVLAGLGMLAYATRDAWWPSTLYMLGMVARAYLVFTSAVPVLGH